MEQGEARRLAKRIAEETDLTPVVDVVREMKRGNLIRGGWPHKDHTWVIFQWGTDQILFPRELRNRYVSHPSLTEELRAMDAGLDKIEVVDNKGCCACSPDRNFIKAIRCICERPCEAPYCVRWHTGGGSSADGAA